MAALVKWYWWWLILATCAGIAIPNNQVQQQGALFVGEGLLENGDANEPGHSSRAAGLIDSSGTPLQRKEIQSNGTVTADPPPPELLLLVERAEARAKAEEAAERFAGDMVASGEYPGTIEEGTKDPEVVANVPQNGIRRMESSEGESNDSLDDFMALMERVLADNPRGIDDSVEDVQESFPSLVRRLVGLSSYSVQTRHSKGYCPSGWSGWGFCFVRVSVEWYHWYDCNNVCNGWRYNSHMACSRNPSMFSWLMSIGGFWKGTWLNLNDWTEGWWRSNHPDCPVSFPWAWARGEPNNWRGFEDCGSIFHYQHRMNDLNCGWRYAASCLCEYDQGCAPGTTEYQSRCYYDCPSDRVAYKGNCHTACAEGGSLYHGRCIVSTPSINSKQEDCKASCGNDEEKCKACESMPTCKAGFDKDYGDQCFQDVGTKTYDQCQAACEEVGGMMPCIYDEEMSAWFGAQYGNNLYVGIRDPFGTGAFEWEDGRCHSEYMNWDRVYGHPKYGGCASNHQSGWRSAHCTENLKCVCQRPMDKKVITQRLPCGKNPEACFPKYCSEGATQDPKCWTKPFQDNPHQIAYEYKVETDYQSWDWHVTNAEKWGGDLASVKSYEENFMISGAIATYPLQYQTSPLSPNQIHFFDSGRKLTAEGCYDHCLSIGANIPCLYSWRERQILDDFSARSGWRVWTGYKRGDRKGWMSPFCKSGWQLGHNRFHSSDQIYHATSRHGLDVYYAHSVQQCVCQRWTKRIDLMYIGLNRESDDLPWKWSDETEFDLDKARWKKNEPNDRGKAVALLVNNRENTWLDTGSSESTRPAVYKRKKQELVVTVKSIDTDSDKTTVKLLPGVNFVGALRASRSNSAGFSRVLRNGYEMRIVGSETVLYSVGEVKTAVEEGFTVNFEFLYEVTGTDCSVNVCFSGNCEKIVSGEMSIPGGDSDEFLIVEQFCDSSSSTTTSTFSGINFVFGGCPEGSSLSLDDEKFLFPLCRCPPNFVSKTTFNQVLASVSDSCKQSSRLDFEALNTLIEMEVILNVSPAFEQTDWFAINMVLGNPTRDEMDTRGIKIVKAKPFGTVAGLNPGRRYLVSLVPYTNPDTKVDNLSVVGSVVTPCTCNGVNHVVNGVRQEASDITGQPTDFTLVQENGHVRFKFRDQSMCEDSYAFTREYGHGSDNVASKESFTPNYYFYSETPCAKNLVDPGLRASDDLMESQLPVGETFTYCVRATALEYMHHPTNINLPSLSSSVEACAAHVIHWEASVKGEVTLEQNAGAIPVRDAVVIWQILDPSDLEVVVLEGSLEPTGPSGQFEVKLSSDSDIFDNRNEFPVKVKARKLTEHGNVTITHTFECDNGVVDCGNDGTIVYLRHLDFEKPLQIVDTTAVPFRGKLVVEGTSQGGDDPGCPIIGARVCLIDKTKVNLQEEKNDGVPDYCVETDSTGAFEFAAVIGTTVSVEIGYFDHEFLPLQQDYIPYFELLERFEDGVFIEADGVYDDWDFKDVTTALLVVDVAGGLCNKTLGTSKLELSLSGGCEWSTELTQDNFRGYHDVPSSILSVKVLDVVKVDGDDETSVNGGAIEDYFLYVEPEIIDVREEKNATDAVDESEDDDSAAEELDQYHIRFQYTGAIVASSILVLGETKSDCTMEKFAPDEIIEDVDSSSLHVIKTNRVVAPIILSLEVELIRGELYCDNLGDTKVIVTNNLGPNDAELEKWSVTPSERDVELYGVCKDGCLVPVEHNEDGDEARISMVFRLGPPNAFNPPSFLRDVRFAVSLRDNPQYKNSFMHMAGFVIVGDFEMDPLITFELPTYKPIMILRSPAGTESSATYENVETTVHVESAEYERLFGHTHNIGGSITMKKKYDICVGLGAEVCLKLVEAKLDAYIGLEIQKEHMLVSGDREFVASFTSTWSYTTGPSDIFVIPMLSVDYTQVEAVSFENDGCTASSQTTTKFSLRAGEGTTTGLSFVSYEHIRDVVIPGVEFQISSMDTEAADYEDQHITLTNALSNWNQMIVDYEATNEKAIKGRLPQAPVEWFDGRKNRYVDTFRENEDFHGINMNRNGVNVKGNEVVSGLVPNTLIEKAEKFENGPEGGSPLSETNRIKFSAEGGVISYTLSYAKMKEATDMLNKGDNEATTIGGTIGAEGEIKFAGFGFTIGYEANLYGSWSSSHHQSEEKETETTVSFELGDVDIYGTDWFNVDVFVDPTYGTFVYNTAGGVSRCPHFGGTEPASRPYLEVKSRPKEHVLPDGPMLFDVQIKNYGLMPSTFELFLWTEQNVDMLTVLASGNSLASPMSISLGAAQADDDEALMTVAVMRGPGKYEFPAVTLGIRVDCAGALADNALGASQVVSTVLWNRNTTSGLMIEYAQPCPPVRWSGALLRDQEFVVNADADGPAELDVTIFNPKISTSGTFVEMVENKMSTRLETVRLKYRKVGWLSWSVARIKLNDTTEEMDYTMIDPNLPEENSYGYRTMTWAIGESQVNDGLYEIQLESECIRVEGGEDFNSFASAPLGGMIDRIAPELYGSPMPQGELMPGEEVIFLFTEQIMCKLPYTFELEVTADGVMKGEYKRVFEVMITCVENRLAFKFQPLDYEVIMGKTINVKLDLVRDLAFNPMDFAVSHSFRHGLAESIVFEVEVSEDCSNLESASEETLNDLREKIAKEMGVSNVATLQVQEWKCNTEAGLLQATVVLTAAPAGNRRELVEDDIQNIHDIYQKVKLKGIVANSSSVGVSSGFVNRVGVLQYIERKNAAAYDAGQGGPGLGWSGNDGQTSSVLPLSSATGSSVEILSGLETATGQMEVHFREMLRSEVHKKRSELHDVDVYYQTQMQKVFAEREARVIFQFEAVAFLLFVSFCMVVVYILNR